MFGKRRPRIAPRVRPGAQAVRLSLTRRSSAGRPACAGRAGRPLPPATRGPGRSANANAVAVELPNQPLDALLFIAVVALVLLGMFVAYATSYHEGWAHAADHGSRVLFGALAMLAGIVIPHRWYGGRCRWAVLALGLGLLAATLLFGESVKGADRWLRLPFVGIQLQPAELAKFALPFWLAAHFADLEAQREPDRRFSTSFLLPALVTLAFLVPTMLQRAIGTTFIMAAAALAVFLLAGVRLRYLALLALVLAGLVLGGILMFPHGWHRLVGFLTGRPWQQEQSIIAIARGRVWGQWLNGSKQAVYFLPEVRTDFAVAAICEEFGFLGSCGVFGLYGLVLWRGLTAGRWASGHFGKYLAAGITVTVFLYAMVHIGVAVGFLPTTGQPLPFVSYGGTAMFANLFAAGVLLNVSRYSGRGAGSHAASGKYQAAEPLFGAGQAHR
ncbi:MAG: FtsW/RodA/SpoVE family cell cycle protein [bacterium]